MDAWKRATIEEHLAKVKQVADGVEDIQLQSSGNRHATTVEIIKDDPSAVLVQVLGFDRDNLVVTLDTKSP